MKLFEYNLVQNISVQIISKAHEGLNYEQKFGRISLIRILYCGLVYNNLKLVEDICICVIKTDKTA